MVEKLDHEEGNGILETLFIHCERTRDRFLPQSLFRGFGTILYREAHHGEA